MARITFTEVSAAAAAKSNWVGSGQASFAEAGLEHDNWFLASARSIEKAGRGRGRGAALILWPAENMCTMGNVFLSTDQEVRPRGVEVDPPARRRGMLTGYPELEP